MCNLACTWLTMLEDEQKQATAVDEVVQPRFGAKRFQDSKAPAIGALGLVFKHLQVLLFASANVGLI